MRATPNQEIQNGGRNFQEALRIPFPLQWGRFLRGGDGYLSGRQANRLRSRFGTNAKLLYGVIGPISGRNDYLNAVFDDAVSLRGSCRIKRPSHGPHRKRFNLLQFSPCV